MKTAILWVASLLAFPLAGAPLLAHPAYRRWGAAARFVLAAAAGGFAVATTMTYWTLLRGTWRLPVLVAAGFAECLLLRLALPRRSSSEGPETPSPRLSGFERLALAAMAVSLLAAAAATLATSATSTDLVLFWGPKSAAFANARAMDADYLADHLHRYQHASYPPLVPNLFAFATLAAGHFSWAGAAATFPLLLLMLAVSLRGVLRSSASRRNALAAAAAITASLAIGGHVLQMAGNADPFLLLFEVLAVAVLLGSGPEDRPAHALAGLLLGGATAAKVEGLPFALCAAGLAALVYEKPLASGWRRPAATLLWMLGPSALALAGWFAFGRQRAVFLGYESYGPALDVHWNTLSHVLAEITRALAAPAWGLPWLVPLAAFVASRPLSRARALYPALIAVVLSFFFVFTYLHGPDPTLWIGWSAGRIFLVVSPLLAIGAITGTDVRFPLAASAEAATGLPRPGASRG